MPQEKEKRLICITGFSTPDIRAIRKYINEIGGIFAANLETKTYCLIVNKVGSDKHRGAIQSDIPCVDVSWLIDCHGRNEWLPLEHYPVPLFKGLIVACTQLGETDRQNISILVEQHGGIFNADLVQGRTTHLLALRREGDKYFSAYRWGDVKVCLPTWIYDSIGINSKYIYLYIYINCLYLFIVSYCIS